IDRGKRGRGGHTGQFGKLSLSQAVVFPQDAQERPMAERNGMFDQAYLKRALHRPSCVFEQVREAVLGDGVAPVFPVLHVFLSSADARVPPFGTRAPYLVGTWKRMDTAPAPPADFNIARQASVVARAHFASCKGG